MKQLLPICNNYTAMHCNNYSFEFSESSQVPSTSDYWAKCLFFLRSNRISNDLSDSLFRRGVKMRPAWLNSRTTGADDGTVVLYLITVVLDQCWVSEHKIYPIS